MGRDRRAPGHLVIAPEGDQLEDGRRGSSLGKFIPELYSHTV